MKICLNLLAIIKSLIQIKVYIDYLDIKVFTNKKKMKTAKFSGW